MRKGIPKIELAQGDVAANARACQRWFRVIAWALANHPDGLFLRDLRREYRQLCESQGSADPYTDDGDFQTSLSRQLQICIAICHQIGWLTFRLEKPAMPMRADVSARIKPPRGLPERMWVLTKSGERASNWGDRKLARSIVLHLVKVGIAPMVDRLRVPLGLLSAGIGVAKIVANWGTVQSMLEGLITLVGGIVLVLLHRSPSVSAMLPGPLTLKP